MFPYFPYTLWGCATMEEFCQTHFDKIYSVVLLKSSENLDEVLEILQNVPCLMQMKDECIPHAIAVTLPLLCKNGFSHCSVTMPTNPMNILYYLMQCCDYDHISSLMQYFMAQVISHLLTMLHTTSRDTDDGDHMVVSCDQPPATVMYFDLTAFEGW
uniref:Serine-protein kinase ATM-like n=1 Tax=Phallusia mammillata TaxID=59560 RepID=A0A6F9D7V7_9ASCI|nr:serine-protein kinase ATM-like [Phallusia mammillata]